MYTGERRAQTPVWLGVNRVTIGRDSDPDSVGTGDSSGVRETQKRNEIKKEREFKTR